MLPGDPLCVFTPAWRVRCTGGGDGQMGALSGLGCAQHRQIKGGCGADQASEQAWVAGAVRQGVPQPDQFLSQVEGPGLPETSTWGTLLAPWAASHSTREAETE